MKIRLVSADGLTQEREIDYDLRVNGYPLHIETAIQTHVPWLNDINLEDSMRVQCRRYDFDHWDFQTGVYIECTEDKRRRYPERSHQVFPDISNHRFGHLKIYWDTFRFVSYPDERGFVLKSYDCGKLRELFTKLGYPPRLEGEEEVLNLRITHQWDSK